MKRILFSAAIALLAFTSCKKNNEETKAVTKENIEGTYKLVGATNKFVGLGLDQNTDIFKTMEACEKDNLWLFKAADAFELKDAGEVCVPSSGETTTWSVSSEGALIIDGQILGKVTSLTSKQLVVTLVESEQEASSTTVISLARQ
jgi:hypothetical protein